MIAPRLPSAFLVAVLAVTGLSAAGEPNASKADLKSFYIATHVVSDAAPFHIEYILDVTPTENGALVREARIAPSVFCPKTFVSIKAGQRDITGTDVEKIARTDLCSLDAVEVESKIDRASPSQAISIFDTASHTVVARCGTSEKVFQLPIPEAVDFKKLKGIDRGLRPLWDLAGEISSDTFGKDFSFYSAGTTEQQTFLKLGAQLLPILQSGAYDAAFDKNYLQGLLEAYNGPAEEPDPFHVGFTSSPEEWVRAPLPAYPALAKQARIFGEVHLIVALDPQTGSVTHAKSLSGHPLLADTVIAALKSWQYREGAAPKDSVEVRIDFSYRCP